MMDFVVELIGELVTVPFDLAMESDRVEVWVKTVLKSICALFLSAVMILVTVLVAGDGELWRTLLLIGVTVGLSVYMVIHLIRGHRRGWRE